jgi:hypothetical protein
MDNKLIKTLSVVCFVLMLIITLEWLYAARAQKKLLNSNNSTSKQTLPDQMPVIGLNLQAEESYADLVNRPLFITGRRPVVDPEQMQAKGVTNEFDWLLSGVYTSKKGVMALLTRAVVKTPDPTDKTPVDNYRKVIVGGNVDGWKVAEIYADAIVLNQDMTEKKLLLRKAKAKKTLEEENNSRAMDRQTTTPEAVSVPQVEPEPTPSNNSENDNNAHN